MLLLLSYVSSNAMDNVTSLITKIKEKRVTKDDRNYMYLSGNNIQAKDTLKIVDLQFNKERKTFKILHHQYYLTHVKPENVDKTLKNISRQQLEQFRDEGNYIKITQLSDGEYQLTEHARGLGGCSSDWLFATEPEHYAGTAFNNIPALPTYSHSNPLDTNLASTNSPQIKHTQDTQHRETPSNTETEPSNK